jgi:glycine cleavage system H protein
VNVPDDRRYTDQHEWALAEERGIRIGITDYAQDALGDVVFVEIGSVGLRVAAGDTVAEIESTKSVAEVYAPVAGEVVAVNDALATAPETVNASPYEDGWFVVIAPDDAVALDALMSAEEYVELIG